MPRVSRAPSHAGSWYEGEGTRLQKQIEGWLAKADVADKGPAARAIIGPHAGYSYCGHVMAHAYRHIQPDTVKRIFLLGPSHYLATRKCCLSSALEYSTPLGKLPIDEEIYNELAATGAFEYMDLDSDETEHSLELHTPYIAKIMSGRDIKLVPIMVGALSTDGEAKYGALLSRYLSDPGNLFIISSDFCHWGSRFRYTFTNRDQGPIWKSIQWLDELGMNIIEKVCRHVREPVRGVLQVGAAGVYGAEVGRAFLVILMCFLVKGSLAGLVGGDKACRDQA
eukprot:GHUV01012273.1.p1 GENE.GHUV01012273.1~~GHUV01012273.1.p1  ORF type:complete len:281 (+),score=40.95 GHUV01012273.1:178-1020(+)